MQLDHSHILKSWSKLPDHDGDRPALTVAALPQDTTVTSGTRSFCSVCEDLIIILT